MFSKVTQAFAQMISQAAGTNWEVPATDHGCRPGTMKLQFLLPTVWWKLFRKTISGCHSDNNNSDHLLSIYYKPALSIPTDPHSSSLTGGLAHHSCFTYSQSTAERGEVIGTKSKYKARYVWLSRLCPQLPWIGNIQLTNSGMEWLRKGFQSGEETVVVGNEVLHIPWKQLS